MIFKRLFFCWKNGLFYFSWLKTVLDYLCQLDLTERHYARISVLAHYCDPGGRFSF